MKDKLETNGSADRNSTTMLGVAFCIALLLLSCWALSAQNKEHRVRNIVLVHGAWADGSGWKGVHDILVKDGYNVSIVQEPETSFSEDVAATKRVLRLQDGPCILVAHSYGGAVITEAGTEPSVAGLVYIAAHMPDAGENEADDGRRFPSDLSKSGAIMKTADGFTYLDPGKFHEYFAADLSAEQAAFMARSQVLNYADNFKAVISTPAWRSKPSWMLVAGADRTINPDLERWYATRANSHKVEVSGASPLCLCVQAEGSCGSHRRSCIARSVETADVMRCLCPKPKTEHYASADWLADGGKGYYTRAAWRAGHSNGGRL